MKRGNDVTLYIGDIKSIAFKNDEVTDRLFVILNSSSPVHQLRKVLYNN